MSCLIPGSSPSSLGLLTRHVLACCSSRRKVAINPTSYTSLGLRKLLALQLRDNHTCPVVQDSTSRQRLTLEPSCALLLPTLLGEFPHLLLLSLLLLLELIQHSLETGLQRQTCQPTVTKVFSTEWVQAQHVKWCSKPQAALTTSPLISCSFVGCLHRKVLECGS